ncbi:hypothetical protein FF2_037713 [Malus domestica]
MLDLWLVEWLLAKTLLERFFVCPCLTSGHFIWGTLDLDDLQKLIYQGPLLCKSACQFYDLSGPVLFAIRIGKAWMECASLSSRRMVCPGHEFELGMSNP